MKIGELIKTLQEIMDEYGDLDAYGAGHPGEKGHLIELENLSVREKDKNGKGFYFIF